MNGKLYTQNLATVANFDGASAVAADGDNRILVKWATALTGTNQGGKMNYRLWVIILIAKGGNDLNGALLQRIVREVMQIVSGGNLSSGWSIYELVAFGADNGGVVPPGADFTLIGSTEAFTLIGSADPFSLIP